MVLEQELLPYSDLAARLPVDGRACVSEQRAVPLSDDGCACWLCSRCGRLPDRARASRAAQGGRHHLSRRRRTASRELFRTSPRRVWAIARLAIKESIRRRVIVALVVYVVILLFASWFLQTDYREPGKLFFSFVLTATTYLVLLIALLLSAFSLPNDFKIEDDLHGRHQAGPGGRHRAGPHPRLHDRRHGAAGDHGRRAATVFVWRMLDHTHAVEVGNAGERRRRRTARSIGKKGRTTRNQYHRHEVEIYRRRHRPGAHRPTSTSTRSRATSAAAKPCTRSAARTACCGPACRSTASCGSSIAKASTWPRASASAASGRIAASSKAARRRPRSGRSAASTSRCSRTDEERRRCCRWN